MKFGECQYVLALKASSDVVVVYILVKDDCITMETYNLFPNVVLPQLHGSPFRHLSTVMLFICALHLEAAMPADRLKLVMLHTTSTEDTLQKVSQATPTGFGPAL